MINFSSSTTVVIAAPVPNPTFRPCTRMLFVVRVCMFASLCNFSHTEYHPFGRYRCLCGPFFYFFYFSSEQDSVPWLETTGYISAMN